MPISSQASCIVVQSAVSSVALDRHRQVEVDRDVAGRNATGDGIGRQDVHGKPTRTLPAIGRNDKDRVGRRHHHLAIADVGDPDVDAALRADEDLLAAAAEAWVDDLFEDASGDLADRGELSAHRLASLVLQESEWAQDSLWARTAT
jgi:hypothetical protein